MSLVSRLAALETVGDMFQAINARFEEATILIDAGYPDGGIYLFGYTAEMILKVAFCRVDATSPPSLTVRSRFADAVQRWQSRTRSNSAPRGYEHSLIFWETVLPEERVYQSKLPLGIVVAQTLSECIKVVSDNWDVKMRYQPRTATAAEADEVRRAVLWMRDNQTSLWS